MGQSRLRELRESRGWSQFELGRRSKTHPSVISSVEHGRLVAGLAVRRRLSRALGLPVEEVFPEPQRVSTSRELAATIR